MTPSISIRYVRTRGQWRRELAGLWSDVTVAAFNLGSLFVRHGPNIASNLLAAGVVVIGAVVLMACVAS